MPLILRRTTPISEIAGAAEFSPTGGTRHTSSLLPVLADTPQRVTLELDLARWEQRLNEVRDAIMAEEAAQRMVEREINQELGHLREQVSELLGEIERLEARISRLEISAMPLSDDELDDEDLDERAENAAYWAEWRQQREEREASNNGRHRPSGNSRRSRELRERYRELARLIHPDLAPDARGREQREKIMRLANEAYEAGDLAQIERLLNLWSAPLNGEYELPSLEQQQRLLEQKKSEHEELRRQLRNLERSELGKLVRSDPRKRRRDIQKESERLRRDLAALRLRRRRLMRLLDTRRRELSEIGD